MAATAQSAEISELKWKLERADEDLVLVNKWLDHAQGMRYSYFMLVYVRVLWNFQSCNVCVCADGAATVETHRGELTQAKEQTRVSKATVDKAVADLTASEGNTSVAEGLGGKAPTETGDRAPGQSDPQPHTTPETDTTPGSSERPPAGEGGAVLC